MQLTINNDEEREEIINRLAAGNREDIRLLHGEGQIEGWTDETGMANWVGYLPFCDRATWITNGDPVWFDATSLEDAIAKVESGEDLSN